MKSLFSIVSILSIAIGFLMFIGTWIHVVINREKVERPIFSLQDAVEIDDNFYLGNGMFKCIQAYDRQGNFIKTIPSNAGPYFYIRQDENGNIVGIPNESHYYNLPFKISKSPQYEVENRLPLKLLFHGSQNDVFIEQSLTAYAMIPLMWLILSLMGLMLLLVTHLILFMEVMASKGSFWDKVKQFKDGVTRK